MRVTLCDICGKGIERNDIRYIKIVKIDKDENERPAHKELEVCVICAEKIHTKIVGETE